MLKLSSNPSGTPSNASCPVLKLHPSFQRMSVAEYLRSEPKSRVKREDVDGFVYSLHTHGKVAR